MTVNSPVLQKQELSRLPFRRRPIAEPGTEIVYQMSSGQIAAPDHPYTSGEGFWRGPRAYFVVDTRPHAVTFDEALPAEGDVMTFHAEISFTWFVHDPVTVVRQMADDVVAGCIGYLVHRMRGITRRFAAGQSAATEREIHASIGFQPLRLETGVSISQIGVKIRADEHHITAGIDEFTQDTKLKLHQERAEFFASLMSRGGAGMAGAILAQDPEKAPQAADFMVNLWQQDQDVAIRAMKVILEGDHVRLGEIDPAIAAVVSRFTALVSQAGGKLAPDALTSGAAATPQIEASKDDSAPEKPSQEDPK